VTTALRQENGLLLAQILIVLGAAVFGLWVRCTPSTHSLQISSMRVIGGAAYLALAQRYWFRSPLLGIATAGACFPAAAVSLSF
jgi:hypothetical protein